MQNVVQDVIRGAIYPYGVVIRGGLKLTGVALDKATQVVRKSNENRAAKAGAQATAAPAASSGANASASAES